MFPEPFMVLHEPRLVGVEDAHGNPVDGWSAPVEVPVYGWGPFTDSETRPELTGLKVVLEVYARTGFAGPGDRVTVDGVPFIAVGHADDFTHGPFGFRPGYRINLKRDEG